MKRTDQPSRSEPDVQRDEQELRNAAIPTRTGEGQRPASGICAFGRPQASETNSGQRSRLKALRQQLLDDIPADVGQPKIAALGLVSELQVIQTQQMQNRGLKIVHVHAVFDGIEA
jgi:hypothetical protein